MKTRHYVFVLAAGLPFAAAQAGDINSIQLLTQHEFRLVSEDLGAALSYKGLTPAEPLGIAGFDIGVAVTGTSLKHEALLSRASSGSDIPGTLPVPSLRVLKGLPLDLDLGFMYSAVPDTNLRLYGGELRWAVLPGGALTPAVAVRASMTKITGADQLDFDTTGLDVSVSKGFAILTPYAGVGQNWVRSAPDGVPGLAREKFTQTKVYAGVNLNLGGNLAFEIDQTGDVTSYGAKFGLRF